MAASAPNPVSHLGRYELRHLVPHLSASGRAGDLHRLLRVEWEHSADPPRTQNAWYAARTQAGELSTYVADVRLAWRLAEADSRRESQSGDPAASIGLEIRDALLIASARSRAHGVPPSLMLALVEKGTWSPMQALSWARELPRAAERAEALRLLTSLLPRAETTDVLSEALAAVQEITGEAGYERELAPIPRARVDALAALAPQLAEPQFAEALAIALSEEPEQRAKALAELSPYLPESLLPEALRAVRGIEAPFLRAAPLAALLPRLAARTRREVADEMMAAAADLPDWWERGLESAFNPNLPELERAALIRERADPAWRPAPPALREGEERALERVRSTAEIASRASELAKLAPYLGGPRLEQALELALAIGPDWDRGMALIGLVPYLPEPLRLKALESARKMTAHPRGQARALAALALYLPEPTRSDLVQEVLALVATIDPDDKYHGRVDVLGAVAPLLSSSQLPQALNAAERAADESARAMTLATIARLMPEPAKSETAIHALAVAHESGDPWTQSNTVAMLGWPLRERVFRDARAASQHIEDPWARASALTTLLPHLPDADKPTVAEQALEAARGAPPWLGLRLTRAFAYLPAAVVGEALKSVESLDRWDQAGALAELAPTLPDGLVTRAFELARSIDRREGDSWSQAEMLAVLAPRLTESQKRVLLSDTLAGEWHRYRAEELAALAPHLPSALVATALAAVRDVGDSDLRAFALAALVPSLAGRQREEAISEALRTVRQMVRSHRWPAQAFSAADLASLVPHLAERDRYDTLQAVLPELRPRPELPDWSGWDETRARALVELAPHLEPSDVGEALRAVCALDEATRGPNARIELLERLAEPLSTLSPTILAPLLNEALANLWATTREQFLNELSALMPAVARAGGAEALAEAAQAIRDVGRWLP